MELLRLTLCAICNSFQESINMFDVVFEGMQGVNQGGLLFGGLILLLIGGGMIGYEIYWRRKAVLVKGRVSGVRVTNAQDIKDELDQGERDIEEEFDKDEEEKSIGKAGLFFGLLFFVFPLVFAVLGANLGYKYLSLTSSGIYVDAVVVRNEASSDSDGTTYNAVVEFRDHSGLLWELRDNVGGGSPAFQKGERVGVYYDAEDPERFVIEAFWHYMGIALIFFTVGSLIFGLLCFLFFKHKKEEAQKKLGTVPVSSSSPKPKKTSFANEMYYPMFEYQDLNGDRKEQLGMVGTNSLLSMKPGTRVKLLMFPDNLEKVRRAHWIFMIIGVFMAVPGVVLLYIAITQYENTPISFLFMLAMMGFIAFRMRISVSSIKDKIEDVAASSGAENPMQRGKNILQIIRQVKRGLGEGRMLSSEEVLVRVKKQAGQAKVAGYILLVLVIGCSIGSYYSGLGMLDLTLKGQPSIGKVVDINSRRSSNTSNGSSYTYHAVVVFNDAQGNKVRFEDSVGSSHSIYDRGDKVDVLYDPARPIDAIIDRGVLNWGLSGGLALGAFLLLLMAFSSLKKARVHGGMKYRTRI